MYYAQLTDSIVTSVTETHGELPASDNLVLLDSLGASLLGHRYDGEAFHAPAATVDPCEWLIDIGPFYDRFGASKMAVLTCTDTAVRAIIQDVNVRKWVDLKRADVAQVLAYIGSVVPSVTAAVRTSILATPVTVEENRALRKQFFA